MVVIYDRMRGYNDIVSGNNVTKFYVINSTSDFDRIRSKVKIDDTSNVITHLGSSLVKYGDRKNIKMNNGLPTFLDIPKIDGYSGLSDSAKINKYLKLSTQQSRLPLIQTIFERSKVEGIPNI